MKDSLLGASARLKAENLQVLASDVEEHLGHASSGLAKAKTHAVLYDGILNDKVCRKNPKYLFLN